MFPTKPKPPPDGLRDGSWSAKCPLTAPVTKCTIWSIPAVPPHVIKRYFYFLCISNTEPKISNGLTNMSFHHELKMGHNCPVFPITHHSLMKQSVTILTHTSFHHELSVFHLQFWRHFIPALSLEYLHISAKNNFLPDGNTLFFVA
jgi:hypothetical protein